MKNKKKGQAGVVPAFIIILSSLLIVSAVVTNSTNESFNDTLNIMLIVLNETSLTNLTISLNETNETIQNHTIKINETINLTIPIENITISNQSISNETINQSVNLTLNITFNNKTYLNETINGSINLNLSLIANNTSPSNYTGTINQSVFIIENQSNISNYIGILAKVFNEDNLDFDRQYRKEYLDWYKNFSDLSFDRIVASSNFIVTVGARNENVKGINVNDNNYVFHLMYCDSYNRYCIFKINGVPTKRLYSFKDFTDTKVNSFDFDQVYRMKINSVEFDFCENRRFCHLGYEGYHVVNVSIERKR